MSACGRKQDMLSLDLERLLLRRLLCGLLRRGLQVGLLGLLRRRGCLGVLLSLLRRRALRDGGGGGVGWRRGGKV